MEELIKTDLNKSTNYNNFIKRKIVKNIFQLVLGLIFLAFSYNYLISHPAEKTSIVSGVTILYQKVEVFIFSILGKDGDILNDKYTIQRNFKEILNTMDTSKCLTLQDYQEVKNYLNDVTNMDLETYKSKRMEVYTFMNDYYLKISKECK